MFYKVRDGFHNLQNGTYWAWKFDGAYDIHHAPLGEHPDGGDVIAEGFTTLPEAVAWIRDTAAIELLLVKEYLEGTA